MIDRSVDDLMLYDLVINLLAFYQDHTLRDGILNININLHHVMDASLRRLFLLLLCNMSGTLKI